MSIWNRYTVSSPEIPDLSVDYESKDMLVLTSGDNMYVARLVYYAVGGHRTIAYRYWSENSTGCGCCAESLDVTHWMELPGKPE